MSGSLKTQDKPGRKLGRPVGSGNAAETRNRIIDAAMVCFAREGYAKASGKMIARQARVSPTLLYHYFESKAAIYRCTLQDANATLATAYRSACSKQPEASSLAQMRLGLAKIIDLTRRRSCLIRFASASASEIERNDELDWLDPEDAQTFLTLQRELLLRARDRGELADGVDIDAVAKMLTACLAGLASMHGTHSGVDEFTRVLRAFERLLCGDLLLAQ